MIWSIWKPLYRFLRTYFNHEGDNYNVCRNNVIPSTFYRTYSRKTTTYIKFPSRKPKDKNTKMLDLRDRLCGLVVRVPGYRSRGPGFDTRRYKISWEVVGLERGQISLMRIIEELLERKSSGSGLENPRLTAVGIRSADHATRSIRKSWHWLRRQAAVARSV
jgi:hypothetical protein